MHNKKTKKQKMENYKKVQKIQRNANVAEIAENYIQVNISPVKHPATSRVSTLLAIANIVEKHNMELGEISEILVNNFHAINKVVVLKREQKRIANELQMVTNDLCLAIG